MLIFQAILGRNRRSPALLQLSLLPLPLQQPANDPDLGSPLAPKPAAPTFSSDVVTGWQCEPGLTRVIHGAPEASLVADVAVAVARLSSVQVEAHFWLWLVETMRLRSHQGELIPNVPSTLRGPNGGPNGGPDGVECGIPRGDGKRRQQWGTQGMRGCLSGME